MLEVTIIIPTEIKHMFSPEVIVSKSKNMLYVVYCFLEFPLFVKNICIIQCFIFIDLVIKLCVHNLFC